MATMEIIDTLYKRKIIPTNLSALFNHQPEPLDNLFLTCPTTRLLLDLSNTTTWLQTIEQLLIFDFT